MVRPENWSLLMKDLQERTGLPVRRIEIGKLNFLRDTAEIIIYYNARALNTAQVTFTSSYHTEHDLFDIEE